MSVLLIIMSPFPRMSFFVKGHATAILRLRNHTEHNPIIYSYSSWYVTVFYTPCHLIASDSHTEWFHNWNRLFSCYIRITEGCNVMWNHAPILVICSAPIKFTFLPIWIPLQLGVHSDAKIWHSTLFTAIDLFNRTSSRIRTSDKYMQI